jgi:hypothetical protein
MLRTTIAAFSIAAAAPIAGLLVGPALGQGEDRSMSFFVTSVGPGNGGDLGGLEGADAHCQQLAEAAGACSNAAAMKPTITQNTYSGTYL